MTDTTIEGSPSTRSADDQSINHQATSKSLDVALIKNVPVTISVEVGRSVLKISDLLRLAQGSVLELDRIAGEPVDLLVHDTVVAQGEVVLINDRYGIRLTRVVTAAERLKNF